MHVHAYTRIYMRIHVISIPRWASGSPVAGSSQSSETAAHLAPNEASPTSREKEKRARRQTSGLAMLSHREQMMNFD